MADGGDRSLNNPCVVVEREHGQVLLMYQSFPAKLSERSKQVQTGHEGDLIVRNHLTVSDDDGRTWSPPVDLTRRPSEPTWVTTLAGGPGIGVQLRHGPPCRPARVSIQRGAVRPLEHLCRLQ